MNARRLGATFIFLLGNCACIAADGWLIVSYGTGSDVVRVWNSASHSVLQLNNNVLYGADKDHIAVLSPGKGNGKASLNVLGKAQGKVLAEYHFNLTPVTQLSGPSNNLIIAGGSAFFVSMPGRDGDNRKPGNALGGAFLLNRVSLDAGRLQEIPLPRNCSNPKVTSMNGVPIVYSWNGEFAWKVDTATNSIEEVISPSDVRLSGDRADPAVADERRIFSEMFVLPGLGIYRLSSTGSVIRFLDSSFLADPQLGDRTKGIQTQGQVLKVFAASYEQQPAIAITRDGGEWRLLSLHEPTTGRVLWETKISRLAVDESMLPLADGSLIYIEGGRDAVMRVRVGGKPEELWRIRDFFPNAAISLSRAIEVTP